MFHGYQRRQKYLGRTKRTPSEACLHHCWCAATSSRQDMHTCVQATTRQQPFQSQQHYFSGVLVFKDRSIIYESPLFPTTKSPLVSPSAVPNTFIPSVSTRSCSGDNPAAVARVAVADAAAGMISVRRWHDGSDIPEESGFLSRAVDDAEASPFPRMFLSKTSHLWRRGNPLTSVPSDSPFPQSFVRLLHVSGLMGMNGGRR